jgi:hypothetical protein
MEQIAREMKLSVEHEFVLAEQALITQQRAEMEAQRMKAEAFAYQQQALIESLQEEKLQLTRRLDLKQRQLKDTLGLLSRARSGMVGRYGLERVMCAWRARATSEKAHDLSQNLAWKRHGRHLAASAFSIWRCHVHATGRDKLTTQERAAAELMRAKLFEQMEMDRSRSAVEVERLSQQLAEEARQRQLLQENLKRVFMRGVCALNFEAMSLLSDGTSPPEASSMSGAACPGPVPAPPFNWAEFEKKSVGSSGNIAGMQELLPQASDAASVPSAGQFQQHQADDTSGQQLRELQAVQAMPEERPYSAEDLEVLQAKASSPRQPPIPSAPPAANASLPFVTWSNPSEPRPAAGSTRGSQVRSSSTSKSQRWQSASMPRAPGQLRAEAVVVG